MGLRDSPRFIALLPVPTYTAVPSAPIKSSWTPASWVLSKLKAQLWESFHSRSLSLSLQSCAHRAFCHHPPALALRGLGQLDAPRNSIPRPCKCHSEPREDRNQACCAGYVASKPLECSLNSSSFSYNNLGSNKNNKTKTTQKQKQTNAMW